MVLDGCIMRLLTRYIMIIAWEYPGTQPRGYGSPTRLVGRKIRNQPSWRYNEI